MLYLVDAKSVYRPEVVAVMGKAFDSVCRFLPRWVGDNNEVRRLCARKIINLVDQGEQDPVRLCKLVLEDLTGAKAPERPAATA